MADILNDENFERFRKLIYDESGITFSETNRPILDGRIKEILRANNIETVEEYYKLITSNKEEMKMMLDSVTTNLTRFFRNQPHFDAFINYVIPHVIEEGVHLNLEVYKHPFGTKGGVPKKNIHLKWQV